MTTDKDRKCQEAKKLKKTRAKLINILSECPEGLNFAATTNETERNLHYIYKGMTTDKSRFIPPQDAFKKATRVVNIKIKKNTHKGEFK